MTGIKLNKNMDNPMKDKKDEELVDITSNKVIGTQAGMEVQGALAELIRRLSLEIKNLNISTSRYSKILLWLTIAMILLGAIQIWLIFIKK